MSEQAPREKTAPEFVIRADGGPFAVAEPVGNAGTCPRCDGTGREVFERDGKVFVRPCGCRDADEAARLFNAARIPRVLGNRTLALRTDARRGPDTFRPYDASQEVALKKVRAFVDRYGEAGFDGRGFCLMGKPGVGKSHLLVGVLRRLTLEKRVPARYVEFFHLLSELKDGYSSGRSEMDLIAPLTEVEVLAIDELGKGRGTDWEMYILDEIISRRYNAGRVTLFASNYTRRRDSTLKARLTGGRGPVRTGGRAFVDEVVAETLEERVGLRIFSRLSEMCDLIEVDGVDYRQEAIRDAQTLR